MNGKLILSATIALMVAAPALAQQDGATRAQTQTMEQTQEREQQRIENREQVPAGEQEQLRVRAQEQQQIQTQEAQGEPKKMKKQAQQMGGSGERGPAGREAPDRGRRN